MNKKIKLLTALAELGYDTEKKIKDADLRKLISRPNIKKEDILMFYDLQDAIRNNSFFSWLMKDNDTDSQPAKKEKAAPDTTAKD